MAERALSAVEAEDLVEQIRRRAAMSSVSGEASAGVEFYGGAVRVATTQAEVNNRAAEIIRGTGQFPTAHSSEILVRLEALRVSLSSVFEPDLLGVGAPPPRPAGLRGAFGRMTILLLRKLLWWYTRSLMAFGDAVGKQFHDEIALLTAIVRAQEEQRKEVSVLRDEIRQLRDQLSTSRPAEDA
jgi:hypothetical protein